MDSQTLRDCATLFDATYQQILENVANQPCCFCGEQLNGWGNDIRPLVTNNGDRCCDKCNRDIVIPNRLKFWTNDYFYTIYDMHTGMYIGELNLPCELVRSTKFKDEQLCLNYITKYGTPDWKIRRILLREDN